MKSLLRVFLLLALCAVFGGGCTDPVTGTASKAEQLNSRELQFAVETALHDKRLDDAAFLFLAEQARLEVDKQVFKPLTQRDYSVIYVDGNGVDVEREHIEPATENDPAAFARAVERFASWLPDVGHDYRPSWNYASRLTPEEAALISTATQQRVLAVARSRIKLLADAEYMRLTKIIRDAEAAEREYYAAGGWGKASAELEKRDRDAWKQKEDAWIERREIEFKLSPETRWHAEAGWKAEDYFDDPQVVALCHAIEANDVQEMERLIAAGAIVKAVGKKGMTPLLWAFPDRKYERFRILLEHGANPNVTIEKDDKSRKKPFQPLAHAPDFDPEFGGRNLGSVTRLAAGSREVEYLRLVLEHGGDPNLEDPVSGERPLDIAVDTPGSREKVSLLLAKGAKVNYGHKYFHHSPDAIAVMNKDYSLALQLFEAGANPKNMMGFLLQFEPNPKFASPQHIAEFDALVKWLEEHGESLEEARAKVGPPKE